MIVLRLQATSERRSRDREEEQRTEESRDEYWAETSRGAEAQRLKPAVSCEENRRENASRNAGGKRSYKGSARARGARGDGSHARTKGDDI